MNCEIIPIQSCAKYLLRLNNLSIYSPTIPAFRGTVLILGSNFRFKFKTYCCPTFSLLCPTFLVIILCTIVPSNS